MARDRNTPDRYSTALGRLMLGALVVMLLGLFLLWRIDSPRVERLRMEITDRVIPNFADHHCPGDLRSQHPALSAQLHADLSAKPRAAARIAADEGLERSGAPT